MTIIVGVARFNKSNDYTIVIKMVMTPNSKKVNLDGSRYGYGLSEYVSVKTYVPTSLGDYVPINEPSSDIIDLSLGYGGKQALIGASYSIVSSDLDITAKCDTPNRKYYVVYNYLPSIKNPFADNKYVTNESQQYGIAQFETKNRSYIFNITYDARFGASKGNSSAPWDIYLNYVRSTVAKVDYTFTLK